MSFAALAWVMDSAPCPTSQTFAALIVFASFANEDGRSYPSTETVAAKSRQNQKTVRAAIATLQLHGLLVDTGRRVGRTGNVRVYALGMEGLPEVGTLKGEVAPDAPEAEQEAATGAQGEALPETGGLGDEAKVPVSGPKPTRKRVAEPIKEPVPLEEANASSAPQGAETISAAPCSKGSKGRSEGWTVPSIACLPPEVQAIARQWPAGAYETHGAGHAAHLAGRRRVHNPDSTWHSRIVQLGEQPLRAAKAGLRYASPAPAPTAPPKAAAPAVAAHDPNGEGAAATALRQALQETGGPALYQRFFEPCRYDITEEQLTVIAPSSFLRDYVRTHYGHRVEAQALRLIGSHATVGWEVQIPA